MQKITPYLWFDKNAEEAVNFYVSLFKDSKVVNIYRNEGEVLHITFQLEGQDFMALNAGPKFKFTEAISFFVACETQSELDSLWEKLSKGGEEGCCGWLKDRFGLSWQIMPSTLGELMGDKNTENSLRVMQAMMEMKKVDIAALHRAYAGE